MAPTGPNSSSDDVNDNSRVRPIEHTTNRGDVPTRGVCTAYSAHDYNSNVPHERTGLISQSGSVEQYGTTSSSGDFLHDDDTWRMRTSRTVLSVGKSQSKTDTYCTDTPEISRPIPPFEVRKTGARTPKIEQSRHGSFFGDAGIWYDQFTSVDWVHDSIVEGHRVLRLRKLRGFRGHISRYFDGLQGWILMWLVGVLMALVAYTIDISESAIFDIKMGYCSDKPWLSHKDCCLGKISCARWNKWSGVLGVKKVADVWIDYAAFIVWCMVFAGISCMITLLSKTVVPAHIAATFDEDLAASKSKTQAPKNIEVLHDQTAGHMLPPSIYYSAAGSGVAEVKVILSGFVLHGYLGMKSLVLKSIGLIFSVASGMSLGKEGPYVHISTCLANVSCRLFSKYNNNDGKRREVLSAGASSGVAVAFGSPLGGVLFGLEEVAYYFPPKTLFRTFFCCIVAALGLKFLNPYGTYKIVLFEVKYVTDWRVFELFWFAGLGCLGGVIGALFIKASRFWATRFRKISVIKNHPLVEVLLVALLTGLASFWNRYTRLPVAELLAELASPCTKGTMTGLCPAAEDIPSVIGYLFMALAIKLFLTIITFGIKVPAGIYVPSMVIGGLTGRIVGHTVQFLIYKFPHSWYFGYCSNSSHGAIEECVTPGVYALAAAGAVMCGVTRLSITLAVILFELTGSLDHVIPFALAVLCAKWTADAVEPHSIYDLLTDMNSYPFLDNKILPVFDTELGDIVSDWNTSRILDISASPLIPATELRSKLMQLQNTGEIDGALPVVRDKILVGLIPAPDLEFALDRLDEKGFNRSLCLMSPSMYHDHRYWPQDSSEPQTPHVEMAGSEDHSVVDFTPFIDPAPVALDARSPMDLVHQCFVKLGLRYVCVVGGGQYKGILHKKAFVKYVKTRERKG